MTSLPYNDPPIHFNYESALECAGATVIAMRHFGSYQGDWLALCWYRGDGGEGEFIWVHGAFGSCAACDRLKAFVECEGLDDATWDEQEAKLAEIGRRYLEDPRTEQELLNKFLDDIDWDAEAHDAVRFLQEWSVATPEGRQRALTHVIKTHSKS